MPSILRTLTLLSVLVATPALAQSPSPATSPAATPAPGAATAPTAGPPNAAKASLLDINTASAEELSALKGIGPARSAAIVKGRPYKGKDDLVHKKIIPEAVYAETKHRIVARQT